jgi:hypothetical protein
MFFMVSYNIDKFRQFVLESTFLKRYEVDPETVEAVRKDDVALLRFGSKWLMGLIYKMEGIKQKEAGSSQEKK